ncbi:Dehydrogenases with different specificities (related to short-chain alcohol dehydrogenases) [hydrothermal vent metagenome]|uniref:Dehydrogenases with different specificities (Related to short-chain alcohol dehydrogenases) n=1 Tax=hydrothermal vent metagenome TaxID=652676 RepID=A0A3B0SVL5_9ZZZZ
MNQIDLKDRHIVVTGGAQGIGLAIARRVLASGATVTLWDRDADMMATALAGLGEGADGKNVDVSDAVGVVAAADATHAAHGRIDGLVNNAGIAGANATVVDYPVEEYRRVMSINLDGPFYCCRAVVPHMIAAGYGRIVNIASIAGKEGNPNAMPYSASKAGVIALTKSLGKELAAYDIAVNAVTPAAAKTAIFDQMKQEHIDYMLSKIPRARFLMPDEAAAMVAWMLTAENSFTTGAVFDLSGGRATY